MNVEVNLLGLQERGLDSGECNQKGDELRACGNFELN